MGKTYTGVDIGDSSIKLAVSDGQSVSKVAIEMLPEGLVADASSATTRWPTSSKAW